jgi:hypothetical protein
MVRLLTTTLPDGTYTLNYTGAGTVATDGPQSVTVATEHLL